MSQSNPEKKLLKFINPNTKSNSKPFLKSFREKNPTNTKTNILDNNRSISRMILFSKTQTGPSSQSFSQVRMNTPLLNINKSEKTSSQTQRPRQINEITLDIARKKLVTDKEQSAPLSLHYDISHQFNKKFLFKSPQNSTGKTITFWKLNNNPEISQDRRVTSEEDYFSSKDKEKEKKIPSEEFYLKTLRKEIPLALREHNTPSSRIELVILKNWLENSKKDIESKFSPLDQIKQKSFVFDLTYQELKRQMSCSCLESGDLLRELWEYQKMTREIEFEQFHKQKKKEMNLFKKEYETMIKTLEGKCKEKDILLSEKQDMIDDLLIESTTKGKSLLTTQENEFNLNKKLTELRKIMTFLKKKVSWLTKENENLTLKLEKKPHELQNSNVNRVDDISSSEIDENEEEDEKILLDMQEHEKPEEHNIEELNQIIISSIPEAKDIKYFAGKETEITPDFYGFYQCDVECQTEFCFMDKLFDKTMKSMKGIEEMCQDYQYKLQIKDVTSRKHRASNILTNVLIEKNVFSTKSIDLLEARGTPHIRHSFISNSIPSKISNENLKELEFNKKVEESVQNDQNLYPNKFQKISNQITESEISFSSNEQEFEKDEKNNEDQLLLAGEESRNEQKNDTENAENQNAKQTYQELSEMNEINVQNLNQGFSEKLKEIFPKSPSSMIIKEDVKDDNYNNFNIVPSVGLSLPIKLSKIKKISNYSSSLEFDFEKVIELFKSENIKAQDFEEKYKRNLEMLQMENAQRKKLEAKNSDMLKIIENLQQELERMRRSEEMTRRTSMIEKRKREKSQDFSMEDSKVFSSFSQKRKSPLKIKKKESPTKNNQKAMNFQLGKHIQVAYEHQKMNLGATLLEKIKGKKMGKFHNFMHIKLILKQIHMIYFERITQMKENPFIKEQDFASYTYGFFLSIFGLKKIADKRFIIMILSLKRNFPFFRVSMFSRFLGLMEPSTLNYNIDELNKYSEALDYICNVSTMGPVYNNSDSDAKFYIPFMRALQYTSLFGDTRMTVEESNELKKEIESFKENDPKNLHKAGIIDFDIFMERILNKYKILVNRAKIYVINAFAACDLDGNRMCNLQEFLLLNRHIESEVYNEEKLEKIFLENADIEKDGEKNLSFDKFSVVCVEFNLFTDEAQNRYLGVTKKVQIEIKMGEITEKWSEKKQEIEKRFENLTILSEDEINNWNQIIQVLDERITGKIEADFKPTLIAYMILDKESERLTEEQKNYIENESDYGDFEELSAELSN